MLEYTSCSYDMISTDIYGTVSNTASRPGIIDHSISGIDCNVADTAFTISSIEDQISTLERIGINRSSQSVICSQIDRGIFMNCQCMVYDIGRWINTGTDKSDQSSQRKIPEFQSSQLYSQYRHFYNQ